MSKSTQSQFISFLSSMDCEYGELFYYTEVKKYFWLREEIEIFITLLELNGYTLVCNLVFLTEPLEHA